LKLFFRGTGPVLHRLSSSFHRIPASLHASGVGPVERVHRLRLLALRLLLLRGLVIARPGTAHDGARCRSSAGIFTDHLTNYGAACSTPGALAARFLLRRRRLCNSGRVDARICFGPAVTLACVLLLLLRALSFRRIDHRFLRRRSERKQECHSAQRKPLRIAHFVSFNIACLAVASFYFFPPVSRS